MIDENVTQFLQNCKYSNKGYKMDTERWQILLKAIDRGSLRAAAEEMGFTVSGISRSVATLEKELGFALLHRAKSGVQPTAECCQLLPSVRELLFAQERLEQTAAKVRGADCGTIVIGTAYNCYYEWVTRMMAAFRTRHPGVVIKIVNGTSSELAEMLLDHRTDFCLISHRDSLPVWLPIRQDELMVLLPKNHPLADRESFPVESLKTEPFIDSYPGMETDITLIFDKLKARPDARYSTMDITATYAMVSAGLGISVNNAINHQGGYPGVVERPMNPHQMMEIGLACGENLAPAAQAFLDFVKERLPECLPPRAGEANKTKTAVQIHARRYIFASIRDNDALILRVEAAQAGAGHDLHRSAGPLGLNAVMQKLGGVLIAALADEHRMDTIVFVLVHLFQNLCQHAGLAAGLEEKVDLAVRRAAAQNTHVQAACDKTNYPVDAAVLGQIVKTRQCKQDVGAIGKLFQRKADVVKCLILADQLVGQLGGTGQRTGAAQRVQHKNFLFGVLLQHHLARGHGGIVAAGQVAADGEGKHVVRLQKVFGPFLGAWAGGGAGTVVVGHGLQHLLGVQRGKVNILAFTNADFKRYKGKLHARCRVFQLADLAGAVGYDHPCHGAGPPFCDDWSRLFLLLL